MTPARIEAMLLGGAVGDALGAAIEFDDLDTIRARFGPEGISAYAPVYRGVGRITDDTQMTLFTLDGLIRAHRSAASVEITDIDEYVHASYLRWLHTQNIDPGGVALDGWLIAESDLHHRRAPGGTCISALRATRHGEELGSTTHALNDSKGCGAVMRAAPAGLWSTDLRTVFNIGVHTGALTHSHASGYLPAGALAAIIAALLQGQPLPSAVTSAQEILAEWPNHEETSEALRRSRQLAEHPVGPEEMTAALGQGWVGEEALAIAVYASLTAQDFTDGIQRAVNHSGDSDSTGSIAGNILGLCLGKNAIADAWIGDLELRHVIERLANDAAAEFGPAPAVHVSGLDYPALRERPIRETRAPAACRTDIAIGVRERLRGVEKPGI